MDDDVIPPPPPFVPPPAPEPARNDWPAIAVIAAVVVLAFIIIGVLAADDEPRTRFEFVPPSQPVIELTPSLELQVAVGIEDDRLVVYVVDCLTDAALDQDAVEVRGGTYDAAREGTRRPVGRSVEVEQVGPHASRFLIFPEPGLTLESLRTTELLGFRVLFTTTDVRGSAIPTDGVWSRGATTSVTDFLTNAETICSA